MKQYVINEKLMILRKEGRKTPFRHGEKFWESELSKNLIQEFNDLKAEMEKVEIRLKKKLDL